MSANVAFRKPNCFHDTGPCITRLRAALVAAGLRPVELALDDEGETVEFQLERGPAVRHMDREDLADGITNRMGNTPARGNGAKGSLKDGIQICDGLCRKGVNMLYPTES